MLLKSRLSRFIIILLALISIASPAASQREEHNIYLFDCTRSMIRNKLWDPAKSSMKSTISTQTSIPGSHFTVIPFGDNAYQVITFDAKEAQGKQKEMIKAFDDYVKKANNTNISDVLNAGFKNVDPARSNKIFLLTDGKPNGVDSSEKVAETIRKWCQNHKNTRLFYVALMDEAINPVIRKAIDECSDAFVVRVNPHDGVIPQITDISSDVYTNLEELSTPRDIAFGMPGAYAVKATASDPHFDVEIVGSKASDCNIKMRLRLKPGESIEGLHQLFQGGEYRFPVTLQLTDPRYLIANPVVTVHVADELPSSLTLAEGVDELEAPDVEWYDSFLWSDAAPDQRVAWDLAPLFKNYLNDSALTLAFTTSDGKKNDFKAWLNGQPLEVGSAFTIRSGDAAMLEVQFDHDAETGKRYFTLVPQQIEGIDMINNVPAEKYDGTSLRTEYHNVWNPLKTALFWILVVIIGALILWFAVLRNMLYPKIKVGKVEFIGPNSYFSSKRIKGARKVVLTSKKRKQNIFSRLFTGEIRFVRADHFSPELAIVPAGGKKRVRIIREGKSSDGWDIFPSSIFTSYEKGTLTRRDTKEKTEIEFS